MPENINTILEAIKDLLEQAKQDCPEDYAGLLTELDEDLIARKQDLNLETE